MITREKVCVSCPSEMGCAGNRCLQGYVTHWFCDNCGMEFSKYQLRRVDEGDVLCCECLGEYAQGLFPIPEEEDYDES
nr:MAG TPA: Putative acetylornithine deacetylase [Caudoviricetes sp.]